MADKPQYRPNDDILEQILDQLQDMAEDQREAIAAALEGGSRKGLGEAELLVDLLKAQGVDPSQVRSGDPQAVRPTSGPTPTPTSTTVTHRPTPAAFAGQQVQNMPSTAPQRSSRRADDDLPTPAPARPKRPIADASHLMADAQPGGRRRPDWMPGVSDFVQAFKNIIGRPARDAQSQLGASSQIAGDSTQGPGPTRQPTRDSLSGDDLKAVRRRRKARRLRRRRAKQQQRRRDKSIQDLVGFALQMTPRPIAQGFAQALKSTRQWKGVGDALEGVAGALAGTRTAAGLRAAGGFLAAGGGLALGAAGAAIGGVMAAGPLAERQRNRNLGLAEFSGPIATGQMQAQMGQMHRTIDASRRLEDSFLTLNKAVMRQKDAWHDTGVVLQEWGNRVATGLSHISTAAGTLTSFAARQADRGVDWIDRQIFGGGGPGRRDEPGLLTQFQAGVAWLMQKPFGGDMSVDELAKLIQNNQNINLNQAPPNWHIEFHNIARMGVHNANQPNLVRHPRPIQRDPRLVDNWIAAQQADPALFAPGVLGRMVP